MKWRLLLVSALVVIGWWGWGLRVKEMLVVCDVGQGNGILIMSGRTEVLDDVGPENGKMLSCLEKYLPPGDKEIEAVIISHWDADHSGGLAQIAKYYKIDKVYSSYPPSDQNEQLMYSADLAKNDVLRFSKLVIEILWPKEIRGESNTDSVVARVSYGDIRFLLMGDVPAEVEQEMVWRNYLSSPVDYLVVSHHGSKSATSEELLDKVTPEEAIISVGKNNRFGHPSQEAIDRLKARGIKIFRTDESGDWVKEL